MTERDYRIALAAVKLPAQIGGFVCEDYETELWHLLRSLLEWCDDQAVDFDRVLADVREDFRADHQVRS